MHACVCNNYDKHGSVNGLAAWKRQVSVGNSSKSFEKKGLPAYWQCLMLPNGSLVLIPVQENEKSIRSKFYQSINI